MSPSTNLDWLPGTLILEYNDVPAKIKTLNDTLKAIEVSASNTSISIGEYLNTDLILLKAADKFAEHYCVKSKLSKRN